MLNLATKLFLALTGAALAAAIGYAAVVGDRAGADLFVALAGGAAIVAAITALALAPDREERLAADAPAPERRTAYTEADVASGSAWPFAAAVAATALALSTALGASWLAAAMFVSLVPAVGWLAHVWRSHPTFSERVRERVNERLLAPLAMPVLATLGALFIAFMVSRVLLAISTTASWVTALILAAALLGALWVIASRPRLQSSALAGLAVVAVLAMTAAGAIGAKAGEREFHPHEPTHPTRSISARNLQFSLKKLELPAETEVVINFANHDTGVYHNVAFYTSTDADRKPLWAGRPVPEGHLAYRTETPPPGTYAFVCDFHPAMTGQLVVTAAPAGGMHEEEGH